MTKKQAIELSPAIQHFAKGNDLYYYSRVDEKWYKQDIIILFGGVPEIQNIIKDKHFDARQAFALGQPIECRQDNTSVPWDTLHKNQIPLWRDDMQYRPKSTEPVYEWQWAYIEYEDYVMSEYHTEEETSEDHDWIKFEPSKRIRK